MLKAKYILAAGSDAQWMGYKVDWVLGKTPPFCLQEQRTSVVHLCTLLRPPTVTSTLIHQSIRRDQRTAVERNEDRQNCQCRRKAGHKKIVVYREISMLILCDIH